MANSEAINVDIISKEVVAIAQPEAINGNFQVIPLSNLDLLSGRFPVTYLFFYSNPTSPVNDFDHIFKSSLSQCLKIFYPFAGTISENPNSGDPEVICDNRGVLVVQSKVDIRMEDFDFYDLDRYLEKLVPGDSNFLVMIQCTSFTCGGRSVTFTFDHALGDASAFSKFLSTFSDIALRKPVSFSPDHSRHLKARWTPRYDPIFDDLFINCTMEQIRAMPTISPLLKRVYFVEKSSIDRLQVLASENGTRRTKIEAFSAYIWKIMVNAIDQKQKSCKMGWLVDGRTRICNTETPMDNYIGNVLSLASAELTVSEINRGSIADIAETINKSILRVTNDTHFRDLIDWIELHKPGFVLSKILMGHGTPTVVISSGRKFPVSEINFGFGSPLLGTMSSTIQRLGVGYINQRQSSKGDDSWIVSTIIWDELAAAFESDPDHILKPMHLRHVQL